MHLRSHLLSSSLITSSLDLIQQCKSSTSEIIISETADSQDWMLQLVCIIELLNFA